MARITDAILTNSAYANYVNQPILDLSFGGQQGWAPNLNEWVSNQAYVRKNLFCVLLESPRFFILMPNPDKWVQALKSLVELHAKTIEGLNAGLTVEFDEHPVGGAGEMQQEITDSKRARSEPSFGFVEKYGMPINTFLQNWIIYGMMDPDTKFAMAGTLPDTKPSDMLADWYSMTCLFIEPDPTHQRVVKAWVITNMMPKSDGEVIGKRDLTSASELSNLTIEFTGIAQYNLGTKVFAQNILDTINITNANPNLRPSFVQGIDPLSGSATIGYKSEAENIGATAIVK
jgi:hypothetical protein